MIVMLWKFIVYTSGNFRVKRETYTAKAKTNNQPNRDNSRNKYNSFYLNTKLVNNKKKNFDQLIKQIPIGSNIVFNAKY